MAAPRFRPGANDSKSLSTSQAAELERRFNRCRTVEPTGGRVAGWKHGALKVGFYCIEEDPILIGDFVLDVV